MDVHRAQAARPCANGPSPRSLSTLAQGMTGTVAGDVWAETLPGLLAARSMATPDGVAFIDNVEDEKSRTTSWSQYHAIATRLQGAMHARGVSRGTRVGILATNSVRWEACQMAALANAAAVVGLDVHHTDATLKRLIECTRVSHLFVGDTSTAERVTSLRLIPSPELWILAGPVPRTGGPSGAWYVDHVLEEAPMPGLNAAADGPVPDDMAIVVFSSGTTGNPKPIGYTHRQVLLAVQSITRAFPSVDASGHLVCWLPLANLFQRIIDFCAIARGNASHVVADPRSVMDVVPRVRPQLLLGVPRFFERVMSTMQQRVAAAPWPVGRIVTRVLEDATVLAPPLSPPGGARARPVPSSPLQRWLRRLVLGRLAQAFGGEARYLVSGSAPLAASVHAFFDAIDLPVFEAYGVSECIVPVALNTPDARRTGTVGRITPVNEVALSAEGEVLVRGPGVFTGYLDDAPGTRRLDDDGYWHTGDRGRFDADGYLVLEGRISDAFKLSTGRWVNPLEIESRLRTQPGIDHAAIIGSGRKVVVAVLDVSDSVNHAARGLPTQPGDAVAPSWLSDAFGDLADYQRPAAYLLVTEHFSVTGGELTVNLKLRRKAVGEKYAGEIDRLYRDIELSAGSPGSLPARAGPWVRAI